MLQYCTPQSLLSVLMMSFSCTCWESSPKNESDGLNDGCTQPFASQVVPAGLCDTSMTSERLCSGLYSGYI